MSIWKSPVLYLGLVLVALVLGALAAPFIVDWSAYRGNLENYGGELSGRKVTIAGPIAVRLFPWPRLEAEQVRIANPVGYGDDAMISAGKMTVNLALAGLASGQIKVESIVLEKPVLNLQLDGKGVGNWHFAPVAAVRQSGLLSGVQLDEISFVNGEINFKDARHGWARRISAVNGQIAGAALEGPWKAKGTGVFEQAPASGLPSGLPIDISVTTGVNQATEPLRFTLRLSPVDGSLPALSFDGKTLAGNIDGKVSLDPVVTVDGRTNPNGLFKPLSSTAQISMKDEQVEVSAIHIVAADPKDSGTLIEGSGHVDLTRGVKAQVALNASHVDLDGLAGERFWRLGDTGGVMGLVNGLIQELPDSADLSGTLNVAALTFEAENVQNVAVTASAGAGAMRIQDLTADLPGLSRMKFSGIAFPGKDTAELGGNLAFETGDARTFVNWMWPQTKEAMGKIWTGSRGRLKAQGDITWSAKQFGLQNAKYELDGLPGKANVAVSLGANPIIDVSLTADDFDLGAYLPQGLSPTSLMAVMPQLWSGQGGPEQKLNLAFTRFTLNGVSANNVAVDVNAAPSGLEVKRFDIGSVEGAELRGNGLILSGADGPSGEVKFAVGAQHPQGLLRLLGLLPKGPDPIWAQGLGQTNVLADVTVKPGKQEPQINGSITGTSGPLKLIGSATATDLLAKGGATLGLSATASSADARDVMKLLGWAPFGPEAGDGQVSLTMQGQASENLRTVVDFEGLGASAVFDGKVRPASPFMGLSGTLQVNADNSTGLLASLGSPIAGGGPLSLSALLVPDSDAVSAQKLQLTVSGQTLTGSGRISANHTIKLDLAGGTLRMADLAGLALAPWNGEGAFPSGRFAASWPLGLMGEIILKPVSLIDPLGAGLSHATLKLNSNDEGRDFALTADDGVNFSATLKQKGAAFGVDGKVAYPFGLEKAYALAGKPAVFEGNGVYQGTFAGEGYSPLALLRGLSGNGALSLSDFKMKDLAPDPFYAAAAAAKTGDELSKAFAELNKGAGVGFNNQQLNCAMQNGIVNCDTARADTEQAAVTFTPALDVAEGAISSDVVLSSKSQADLPAMHWLFSGVPGAVGEKLDSAALSAKLGTALINKDMEELARLQKEQQKVDADAAQQAQDDKTKFEAFQSQRNELRLQVRMIKVFQQQRALDEARLKASIDQAIAYGQSILKEEKRRFLQRLVH
jgi:AsmA family/AsmA-like C-terminal region